MIADGSVMAGSAALGQWFAIEHWNVVPDIISMAKGLTSATCRWVRSACGGDCREVQGRAIPWRAHLQQPPPRVSDGAGDDCRDGRRPVLDRASSACEQMKALHGEAGGEAPSVGAVRSIGLFGIVAGAQSHHERADGAVNGTSTEMAALGKFFRQEGSTRWPLELFLQRTPRVHH